MTENRDNFNLYLQEIEKYPILSRDEEKELFVRLRSGDESARELLINSNLRFVVSIARSIAMKTNHIHELFDLVQEGNFGLIEAIERHDLSLNYRLSTYAVWGIKKNIYEYLVGKGRIIKSSDYYNKLGSKINRIKEKELGITGNSLSYEEIASVLSETEGKKYTAKQVEGLEKRFSETKVSSLDIAINRDRDDSLVHFVKDEINLEDEVVSYLSREKLREVLYDLLSKLNDREREILKLRFGIECDPSTLEEIGSSLGGISRERVRKLQNRALLKMRRYFPRTYPKLYSEVKPTDFVEVPNNDDVKIHKIQPRRLTKKRNGIIRVITREINLRKNTIKTLPLEKTVRIIPEKIGNRKVTEVVFRGI